MLVYFLHQYLVTTTFLRVPLKIFDELQFVYVIESLTWCPSLSKFCYLFSHKKKKIELSTLFQRQSFRIPAVTIKIHQNFRIKMTRHRKIIITGLNDI